MYLRPYFVVEDLDRAHAAIEEAHLGMIVTANPAPNIAHMPVMLRRGEGRSGTLYSHVPRKDPVFADIRERAETVIVFTGPAEYISPRWYLEPYLPTYNHVAIHASGVARPIDDREEVLSLLGELVDHQETRFEDPWSLGDAAPELVDAFLGGLQMFALPIDKLEAKFKLSQNLSAADRTQIIAGLRELGSPDALKLAEVMDDFPYPSSAPIRHELLDGES